MKRKTETDAAIERARALIQSCKSDGGYFVPSLDVFKLETRRVAFDLASVARSLLASTTSAKRQRFLKYIARRAERIARGPVNEKTFFILDRITRQTAALRSKITDRFLFKLEFGELSRK